MARAPDECPVCGSPIPPGSISCVRCGWAVSAPSAPYPPPLDFTHPPPRPIVSDEVDEEEVEGRDDESEEDEVDEDDIDADEGFWTGPRVVRLVLLLILVLVILLVVVRG